MDITMGEKVDSKKKQKEKKNSFLGSKKANVADIVCLLVVTGLSAASSFFDLKGWLFFSFIIVCIIFMLFYEVWTVFHRENYEQALAKSADLNKSFQKELESISEFCSKTSRNLDSVLKKKGDGNEKVPEEYSFVARSKEICADVFSRIGYVTGNHDIEVLLTVRNGDKIVTICTAVKEGESNPSILEKEREISATDGSFRDVRYFAQYKEKGSNCPIEVSYSFEITDDRLYKNNNKFGQYIFVPIISDNELFGLIEVFSYKGKDMAKGKGELEQIANDYLSHYSKQLSLMESIDKFAVMALKKGGASVEKKEENKDVN